MLSRLFSELCKYFVSIPSENTDAKSGLLDEGDAFEEEPLSDELQEQFNLRIAPLVKKLEISLKMSDVKNLNKDLEEILTLHTHKALSICSINLRHAVLRLDFEQMKKCIDQLALFIKQMNSKE